MDLLQGGIQRKLEEPDVVMDYPIPENLKAEGVTDYVAMPMVFSDGQINIISLASKTKGGFSLAQLGQIHEILPTLSRFFEVHSTKQNAVTLLNTYLGQRTGQRINAARETRSRFADLNRSRRENDNEASRMEDKCKELGYSFLVSDTLASSLSGSLQNLGNHHLLGISNPLGLFALTPEITAQTDLSTDHTIA